MRRPHPRHHLCRNLTLMKKGTEIVRQECVRRSSYQETEAKEEEEEEKVRKRETESEGKVGKSTKCNVEVKYENDKCKEGERRKRGT